MSEITVKIYYVDPWPAGEKPSTDAVIHAADNQPVAGNFSESNIGVALERANESFIVHHDVIHDDGIRRIIVLPRQAQQ